MAAVVRHDNLRSNRSGDLGDVGVVNAAAHDPVGCRGLEEGLPDPAGKLMNLETSHQLLSHYPPAIGGREPEFFRKPGRNSIELQATVPCRVRTWETPTRDRIEDPLSRPGRFAEIDHSGQKDTRIEEFPVAPGRTVLSPGASSHQRHEKIPSGNAGPFLLTREQGILPI